MCSASLIDGRKKEADFQYFLERFQKAGERIEKGYFILDIAGDSQIEAYRERVYCYELYHQLRSILGVLDDYTLNGEVDKRGHPLLESLLGEVKPDFIYHMPGKMENNLVVVEVKRISTPINEINKDINKLKGFLEKAGYYRAIILVYGKDEIDRIGEIKEKMKILSDNRLLLFWHSEPGNQIVQMRISKYPLPTAKALP